MGNAKWRWQKAIRAVAKDLKWDFWKDAIEFEKHAEWPDQSWRKRIPIGYLKLPRGETTKDYVRIRGLYYKRKYNRKPDFVPRRQHVPIDIGVSRVPWKFPDYGENYKLQPWLKRRKGDGSTAVYENGEFIGYE